MANVLTPPLAFEPAGAAPVELVLSIAPEAWLNAQVLGRAERKRRSKTGLFAAAAGPHRFLTNPATSVVIATLVVAVLAANQAMPGLIRPDWAWSLTWAPFVLFTMVWWAVLPVVEQSFAAAHEKALNPKARPGAPLTEMRVCILPSEIEAAGAGQRWHVLRSPWHTAVETSDAFVVVLDDQMLPVPKAGLDVRTTASLRAALRPWQLRPAPPRPSYVMPLLAGVLSLGGILLLPGLAAPARSLGAAVRARPDQATVRLTDRSMRLDGARTSIEDEFYLVWVVDGQMYDQLRGTVKHRVGEGQFWLGRHAPGNTVRTPEDELRHLRETAPKVEDVSEDVVVSALPDNGVLMTWPDKQAEGACGAVRSYRDQVPPGAIPAGTAAPRYRRNLLLRFCAPGLSPTALGDWLVAAMPAFYAEFNSAVRP